MVNKDDLKRASKKMAFGLGQRDVFPVAMYLKNCGVDVKSDPTMGGPTQR